MGFQNQFALSLEVTRLVPTEQVVEKAYQAALNLARNLRNCGSDIVIEEDLADVFGRSTISPHFETSFSTVIKKEVTKFHELCKGMSLREGLGPTVGRSLKHRPYFSIVQLSLLTWVAPNTFLAEAISNALHKRLIGASEDDLIRAPPDQEGISGVLVAMHEQTSSFHWSKYLDAYAKLLPCINNAAAMRPPSAFLLQGLVDMFPMVQRLPDDSMIYMRCCSGFCSLVVWAHVVLGLNILIKSAAGEEQRFGIGVEQVLIEQLDPIDKSQCSISLLDSSREELFCIIPDPGEDLYPLLYLKWPARGFANFTFGGICAQRFPKASENERLAAIECLLTLTGSIAAIICDNLKVDRFGFTPHNEHEVPWVVRRYRLLQAARLLFDKPELRESELEAHKETYYFKALDDSLVDPYP